ncbi:MAG: teichoic acid biosynthesis protein, partial [Desulfovibrio sp.]|nr:teichoic acid biosynthesis protein [Desulfovibrio sp.]
MGRVLYGVHGTGHGHAMRGLTIARKLAQHEFLFLASDDAVDVLAPEFRVQRIPNLGTVFKNYKVDLIGTIAKSLPL